MSKDMVNKLVDMVYKATISGNMKWKLANSIFNSDTRHNYESISLDGKTKFKCDINLEKDLSGLLFSRNDTLRILNDDIIDGSVSCDESSNVKIKDIYVWIYLNHVKPSIPMKNQEKILNDIANKIDISEYRDSKINVLLGQKSSKDYPPSILDNKKTYSPKEIMNDIPVVCVDKRSLLKRVFNIK